MNNLQQAIFNMIEEDLYKEFPQIKECNKHSLVKTIFKNHRENSDCLSIRLTIVGYNLLKTKIKFYDFSFDDIPFTTRHILWLERTQKSPYYYNEFTKNLSTSSEHLALHLKVSDRHFNFE